MKIFLILVRKPPGQLKVSKNVLKVDRDQRGVQIDFFSTEFSYWWNSDLFWLLKNFCCSKDGYFFIWSQFGHLVNFAIFGSTRKMFRSKWVRISPKIHWLLNKNDWTPPWAPTNLFWKFKEFELSGGFSHRNEKSLKTP